LIEAHLKINGIEEQLYLVGKNIRMHAIYRVHTGI